MCHESCIAFGKKAIQKNEIEGKMIIEVGSYNVNGSLRKDIESFKPAKYVGVDMKLGPCVDSICDAENLIEVFGKEVFDVVISTELMEHVSDWKKVISNLKNICVPGGIILISTRSKGFGYHGYPYDFWRYEVEDMKEIFSDCKILILESDSQAPGVFIKVQKPIDFKEKDLSKINLYNMLTGQRDITYAFVIK